MFADHISSYPKTRKRARSAVATVHHPDSAHTLFQGVCLLSRQHARKRPDRKPVSILIIIIIIIIIIIFYFFCIIFIVIITILLYQKKKTNLNYHPPATSALHRTWTTSRNSFRSLQWL